MRQALLMILLLLGGLVCFMGYCAMWIDWVQDAQNGVYERNYLEAFLETSAIGLYTYLALRFMNTRYPLW